MRSRDAQPTAGLFCGRGTAGRLCFLQVSADAADSEAGGQVNFADSGAADACSTDEPRDAGPIAQRLEQRTHNPLVPGSNPGGTTLDCPSGEIGIHATLRW